VKFAGLTFIIECLNRSKMFDYHWLLNKKRLLPIEGQARPREIWAFKDLTGISFDFLIVYHCCKKHEGCYQCLLENSHGGFGQGEGQGAP
jgi:hypothetical protein